MPPAPPPFSGFRGLLLLSLLLWALLLLPWKPDHLALAALVLSHLGLFRLAARLL